MISIIRNLERLVQKFEEFYLMDSNVLVLSQFK